MAKKIYIIIIIVSLLYSLHTVWAEESLAQRLFGRILLEVESNGEAWYVNPVELKRYYLGRPSDAFDIMKKFGIGITNENLNKIPISLDLLTWQDADSDGLPDLFEESIGTNTNSIDSDNDSYNDKLEIENNYNPNGEGKILIDFSFAKKNAGKIFLQVENNGEAWYINPVNLKRYYLARPSDAFSLMRQLGLGITNNDISEINIGYLNDLPNNQNGQTQTLTDETKYSSSLTPEQVFHGAAKNIILGDTDEAIKFFTSDMEKVVESTMNLLDKDEKFTLGNLMLGAKLSSSGTKRYTYKTEVYFSLGGYMNDVYFYIDKQSDGSWKLINL